MTQPNKENIRKWVKALRSGEYKQTTGTLGNRYGFCCLGIACEAAIRDGLAVSCETDDDCDGMRIYDGERGMLPVPVQQWLGINSDNPSLGKFSAAEWNDGERYTFSQIADLIEKKYLSDEVAS